MLDANDRDVAVKERVTSAIKEWCKGLNGVTSIDFSIPDGVVYVKLTSKAKAGEGNLQHVPAISFIRPDMRLFRSDRSLIYSTPFFPSGDQLSKIKKCAKKP